MSEVHDIALVYSPHEWVEALHRHCMNTGQLRIRALIYDATALEHEDVDVCIISESHPMLSRSLVENMHERNTKVIAISETEDGEKEFLANICVDGILSSQLNSSDMTTEILELLSKIKSVKTIVRHRSDRKTPEVKNKIISVLGTGGSGSTEVAIHLASFLDNAILIDTDLEQPSVSMRLGANIEPNIIDAIEISQNSTENITPSVQEREGIRFIAGTIHHSFSKNIKGHEIAALLDKTTSIADTTICDLGKCLTEVNDSEAKTILYKSDFILLVTHATPIGVVRAIDMLSTLNKYARENVPIVIILNLASKRSDLNRQLSHEISGLKRVHDVVLVEYIKNSVIDIWKSKLFSNKNFLTSISKVKEIVDKSLKEVIVLENHVTSNEEMKKVYA